MLRFGGEEKTRRGMRTMHVADLCEDQEVLHEHHNEGAASGLSMSLFPLPVCPYPIVWRMRRLASAPWYLDQQPPLRTVAEANALGWRLLMHNNIRSLRTVRRTECAQAHM